MQILRKCIAESIAKPHETLFECAWNGTYNGVCHVLILVMPNVLVVPDVDFVITAAAALSAKG